MSYTDTPDSIYASLTDIGRINLARTALGDIAFKIIGFSVGRGGYLPSNPVKITAINTSLTDLEEHIFPYEIGPTYTLQSKTGVSTTGYEIDTTNQQKIATSFAPIAPFQLTNYSIDVKRNGSPIAGNIIVKIVKDNAGFPSALPADLIFSRTYSVLTMTTSTLQISSVNTNLDVATYWMVVEADTAYYNAYNAVDTIEILAENTNSVPIAHLYNGSAWTVGVKYVRHSIVGANILTQTQKSYINYENPTGKTAIFNCRLNPTEAIAGLGEIGLWGEVLNSTTPSEIGEVFLFSVGHFPLQVKTRRQASVYRMIVQL